jgi:hypothetical protein
MASTLNVFQRLARQWDQIHPYNAAQVLKIEGTPDLAALQEAWHDALNDLGLGRVQLSGDSFHYECLNGEMIHYGVRVAAPGVTLEDCISDELNRPFDNPLEPPFRPFVVPGDGFFYAGVIYHHWVADSVSIRVVLREWFVRLFDPKAARRKPVELPEGGYRRFFGIARGPAAVGHGLLTATRWASSLRKARRFEERRDNGRDNGHGNGAGHDPDFSVRVTVKHAPAGWVTGLLESARRRRVTLNDYFLTAIARVCERYVPLKHRPRRHSLALGSIVDLRPYGGEELSDAFGLFLGFTNVVCKYCDLRDPQRLLRSIAVQGSQQKRAGVPQASALRMLAGVYAGEMFKLKPQRIIQFYQKHVPMAGGISNVNMNRSWAPKYHPGPLLDYIRVSPTGPLMPLVFATTTLGKGFHFALTYRPSVVPRSQIDELAGTFIEELNVLAQG